MTGVRISGDDRLERIRYELTLPVQSQFIRNDVEFLLGRVSELEAALRVARPYVDVEWGTGGWQKQLEADQEMIDGVLGEA